MKPVVLIGAGGHARSVLAMLSDHIPLAGYTSPQPVPDIDLMWMGSDEAFLSQESADNYSVHIAVGFNHDGSLKLRRSIAEKYSDLHHVTLISPTAWIARDAVIEDGVTIMTRAVVNAHTTVGCDSVINTGAIVEHDCHIGERCFISPGAVICGHVTIGHDTLIGAGAVLRNNINIPADTIIGMGAVVTKSIETPGVYVGNPAKLLHSL